MKRAGILLKRIDRIDKLEGKIVIGVIGTHKGVGVTHMAIILANYLVDGSESKLHLLSLVLKMKSPI